MGMARYQIRPSLFVDGGAISIVAVIECYCACRHITKQDPNAIKAWSSLAPLPFPIVFFEGQVSFLS